jgi:uncharacterized protein YjbI with pentapeptide repeats
LRLPTIWLGRRTELPSVIGAWQRIIQVAEVLTKLAIFVAIINYLWEIPDRADLRHYQAWTLINSAHRSSGDGGRRQALEALTADEVNLAAVDLEGANLTEATLREARMPFANLTDTNLTGADFSCRWRLVFSKYLAPMIVCLDTNLNQADLRGTTLFATNLSHAMLIGAKFGPSANTPPVIPNRPLQVVMLSDFSHAWLSPVSLKGVMFSHCNFDSAHILGSLEGASFWQASTFRYADVNISSITPDTFPPQMGRSDFTGANVTAGDFDERDGKFRWLTESDFPNVILCNTTINGVKSNRDCPTRPHVIRRKPVWNWRRW